MKIMLKWIQEHLRLFTIQLPRTFQLEGKQKGHKCTKKQMAKRTPFFLKGKPVRKGIRGI